MTEEFDRLCADIEAYSHAQIAAETDPDELASALLTHGAALSLAAYGRPPTAALLRRLAEAVEKTRG